MNEPLSLPQFDKSDLATRKAYLQDMQKQYAFSLTYDGVIATVNTLPKREEAGFSYKFKALWNMTGILPSLPGFIAKWVKFKLLKRPYKSYDDYFFFSKSSFPNPAMREHFLDNKYLGYQRVAGMNPVVLEGVNAQNPLPSSFKVTAEVLGMSEAEYSEAYQDLRFYMTDYSMLKALLDNPGEVDGSRKYIMPAIALYYREDDGTLSILAVQLDATSDTNNELNPIILPQDERWNMARTYIQAADGTHQELWTHATRIHYVLESVIMVSWRQLGEHHPLLALLKPHLKFTLSVNVNPLFEKSADGTIPSFGKMFACDNDALVAFMGEGMKSYSFKEFILPTELANRHVTDPRLLYPYRDDGLLMWEEVKRFVGDYIRFWYKSDDDVAQDYELQNWAAELGGTRENNNCGLTDFPTEFQRVDQLIEIVAHIIFVATAHHSSVHYPQYECAGFPPNLPFSAYVAPMVEPNYYQDEEGLVKFFPPYAQALEQAFIFYLTNFKVNRMGEYEAMDRDITVIIRQHQDNLQKIHHEIEQRNKERLYHYSYMDPSQVPNSVTV
ncbi:lipoxygenase family protein [Marinomonas transparens]|uniref:Lipoxygenase domain-containing protein n=1 Tax=Marinomonas transparens TaxID=2795388 RepID=A0A934JZG7_9GAMM|nr:lipoxygenase family protein [Marinomonas transparens]MBJ7539959.1 hypothetical protein [Marinomonas transparens]